MSVVTEPSARIMNIGINLTSHRVDLKSSRKDHSPPRSSTGVLIKGLGIVALELQLGMLLRVPCRHCANFLSLMVRAGTSELSCPKCGSALPVRVAFERGQVRVWTGAPRLANQPSKR